jgi:hypothetical protein
MEQLKVTTATTLTAHMVTWIRAVWVIMRDGTKQVMGKTELRLTDIESHLFFDDRSHHGAHGSHGHHGSHHSKHGSYAKA